MTVEATFTGNNTRLRATQRVRIADADKWKQVWMSHTGLIEGDSESNIPHVDFSRSMVVAIVEKAKPKTSGFRVHRAGLDDEVITIDYAPVGGESQSRKKPRAENVYAFFVIPRHDYPVSLRRPTKDKRQQVRPSDFEEVARLPEIVSVLEAVPSPQRPTQPQRMINIEFAHDPGAGNYDGVIGTPHDLWNFVSVGTTAKDFLRYSDTSASGVRMRVSTHDGAWGIEGQDGIYRGYIYHNCQCVDLEVTILDLPAGSYWAYVYAHGDAPQQNARIEVTVGDELIGKEATANDGTWAFRSKPFVEGVHYVRFEFDVQSGDDVRFVSHRDGSDYSMFNAIQIVPVENDDTRGVYKKQR